jgi:hypothetical protein
MYTFSVTYPCARRECFQGGHWDSVSSAGPQRRHGVEAPPVDAEVEGEAGGQAALAQRSASSSTPSCGTVEGGQTVRQVHERDTGPGTDAVVGGTLTLR